MDDSGQLKDLDKPEKIHRSGQEPVDSASNSTTSSSGESQQSGQSEAGSLDSDAETANDRASRMDAAKAFYRAMYAGENVDPEQFGIELQPERPSGARSSCSSCAQLQSELGETQQKAQEAENLYKRMAADFENYRRRIERERDEFQALGIQRAVEAILPALDDLDRAKTSLNNVNDPKNVAESLNLVYNRFLRCLEQIGIKPLEVIGEQFDPRFHEPVQQIPTNEFEEGSVMHELRRGYAFGQKVLRPSLVNVAAASNVDSDEIETSEPEVIDLSVRHSKGRHISDRHDKEKEGHFESPSSEPDIADASVVKIIAEEEGDTTGQSGDNQLRTEDAQKSAEGIHSRDRTKSSRKKEPPRH